MAFPVHSSPLFIFSQETVGVEWAFVPWSRGHTFRCSHGNNSQLKKDSFSFLIIYTCWTLNTFWHCLYWNRQFKTKTYYKHHKQTMSVGCSRHGVLLKNNFEKFFVLIRLYAVMWQEQHSQGITSFRIKILFLERMHLDTNACNFCESRNSVLIFSNCKQDRWNECVWIQLQIYFLCIFCSSMQDRYAIKKWLPL
jgi:hypothetical protein